MRKNYLFVLLFALACSIDSVHAQLYSYTNATTGAYSSVATHTTGAALSRVNGATAPASPCSTGFNSTGYSATTTYSSSLKGIEAEVTANAGYQLSVTGFSAGLRRSGSGPVNVMLAYSVDGGTTWIDKGTNDNPNMGSCGVTSTAVWNTAVTATSIKFRIYAFNAASAAGTLQVLNLTINGSALTTDSVFTSATSFGPFCANMSDTVSVPFSVSGSMSGLYYVQLSDSAGAFPADATSNIISTGDSVSPAAGVIPAGLSAGNYLVRVVKQSPAFYGSGSNGSNIVINPTVTAAITVSADHSAICSGDSIMFMVDNTTNGGSNPAIFWYRNQTIISTGQMFTTGNLADGDSVYAVLISNALCRVSDSAWSNHIMISVFQPTGSASFDTICPGTSFTFHGVALTQSGIYTDTLTSVHGCDSTVVLLLYVLPVTRDTMHVAICQGDAYSFHGNALTIAGVYSDTLRCDSISTLILDYKTVRNTNLTASICAGSTYLFNGQTLSAAGNYSDTIRCDSIVNLALSFKIVQNIAISANICPGTSYDFGGVNLNVSGTYTDTVRCDSIVTLTLSVKTLHTSTMSATICPGATYVFGGRNLIAAGSYNDTVRCDSIVTLTLTVKSLNLINSRAHVCQGTTYNFHGRNLSSTGVYTDTVSCDSIVTLTLTVNALPTPVITEHRAMPLDTLTVGHYISYQWYRDGHSISGATGSLYIAGPASGYYNVFVTDSNGCTDSARTIHWVVVGIDNVGTEIFDVYPNPSNGILYIQTNGEAINASVTITDMIGQVVKEMTLTNNTKHTIDVRELPSGLYNVSVGADGRIESKRIMIK